MIILTLRTDKPESEIGIYEDESQLIYHSWLAHRELAETIHQKILYAIESQKLSLKDIKGIIVYEGPGSFTGLRIGISVANALAYGLGIPIIQKGGETWREQGLLLLLSAQTVGIALPVYGTEAHVTLPSK